MPNSRHALRSIARRSAHGAQCRTEMPRAVALSGTAKESPYARPLVSFEAAAKLDASPSIRRSLEPGPQHQKHRTKPGQRSPRSAFD